MHARGVTAKGYFEVSCRYFKSQHLSVSVCHVMLVQTGQAYVCKQQRSVKHADDVFDMIGLPDVYVIINVLLDCMYSLSVQLDTNYGQSHAAWHTDMRWLRCAQVTNDISSLSCAELFSEVGKRVRNGALSLIYDKCMKSMRACCWLPDAIVCTRFCQCWN